MLYRYLVLLPLMALLSMNSSIAADNLICGFETAEKAGWKKNSSGYCYASQGWDKWEYTGEKYWNTDEEQHPSHYFWHVAQGTMIMPYDLFMALLDPTNPTEKKKFSDIENLKKFGFIPSIETKRNPDGLPIGFVKDKEFKNPYTGVEMKMLGFNCAACHTGEVHYKGEKFLIEGGQAMVDMGDFKNGIKKALEYTLKTTKNTELKKALIKYIKQAESTTIYSPAAFPEEGIGRIDALTRIGNLVFGEDLRATENVRPVTAPVSYPPLWTVPWFNWAQYNGSIRQPMVRNIGEALGINALVKLTIEKEKETLFDSSVNIPNLVKIEELLQGTEKLKGLTAPQYPGGIDVQKAQQGRALYTELCQSCHLPPVNSKEILTDKYWEKPNEYGKQYLITHNIPLETIGTDPTVALEFYKRTADASKLADALPLLTELKVKIPADADLNALGANDGLKVVTEAIAKKWYKKENKSQDEQDKMNGYRKNIVLKPLAYRARPLNGVWATPPYLHNGSILNIYELLSPYEERTKVFYSGTKEFDSVNVGYKNLPIGTKIDTTQPGNFNTGHEFNNIVRQGVIGRKLSEEERYTLVEYIKTLH